MEPVKRMFGTVKLTLTAANVFVCLFVFFVCWLACLGFLAPSKICHPYGDVAIAGEELQILTCALY